jgi:P4 family phage/plasmid primase-like protien
MKNDSVLEEAKRLHDLGFAIHWCWPRAKNPVRSGWTTGERETWNELSRSYRVGFNVGVRLGRASRIDGAYLACFDLDVKKSSARKVAEKALSDVVQGRPLSEVTSGGGNGSRHLYFLTQEPFKMVKLGGEKDAWELCAYSEGRQMILPPSIHPSGEKYVWKTYFGDVQKLTLILFDSKAMGKANILRRGESSEAQSASLSKENKTSYGPLDENVDVRWHPRVTENVRALIVDGVWKGKKVEDRSAYLMLAASSLYRSGLSESEVLGVLTDRSTFLGACAFDHAQTTDRRRAALWLSKYTTGRARSTLAPGLKKAAEYEKEEELEDWEAALQNEAIEREENTAPSARGFYVKGAKGGLHPDYAALLQEFEREYTFKTLVDMNCVFRFTGTHYVHLPPLEIKSFPEKKMKPAPPEKTRLEFFHKVMVNQHAYREFFTRTMEGKINFKNGVLDVDGFLGFGEHSPDYGFRSVLPYDYDPEAKCPRFQKWISDTMEGDSERISVLQEYMGYIVRGGEYSFHKALWLQGTGRNGKSTFVDVLKALIGSENYSTISIKALMGNVFMNAELDGKLANFSEETSKRELTDSGPFKNLTGDGESSAQKKYGDPYKFRNRAKLIMTYNEKPDLSDLSGGMLSRPLIVPFERVLKEHEQDHGIKKKLMKELSGIFNFALEGWERLSRQGEFTRCLKSEKAKRQVENDSCNVSQWIAHYIEFTDENNWTSVGELYLAYKKAERYAFNINHFGARLKKHSKMNTRFKRFTRKPGYRGVTVKFLS